MKPIKYPLAKVLSTVLLSIFIGTFPTIATAIGSLIVYEKHLGGMFGFINLAIVLIPAVAALFFNVIGAIVILLIKGYSKDTTSAPIINALFGINLLSIAFLHHRLDILIVINLIGIIFGAITGFVIEHLVVGKETPNSSN